MSLLQPAPTDFLKVLRARSRDLGITTADTYLREFVDCLDGACPSNILKGVTDRSWRSLMKRASRTLVYHGEGLDLGDTFRVDFNTDKELQLPKGLELPAKTIAWVPVDVTTPTRDRDGDVLETLGAELDLRSAHLFNHLPCENVGRVLAQTRHTKKILSVILSLMQTEFAENVATMYEHGSLRTSHGFLPEEWEPLEDGQGFHIIRFKILEVSGVSIPSNPDAGPTGFSRNKLTHPLLKEWGRMKFRQRPVQITAGIDLSQLPPGTIIMTPTNAKAAKPRPPVTPEEIDLVSKGHGVVLASCGHVVESCRCKHGSQLIRSTLAEPCEECSAKPAEAQPCTCSKSAEREMQTAAIESESKSVVPFTDGAVSDKVWDADGAIKRGRAWAGVDEDDAPASAWKKFRKLFAIQDGDADKIGSYKLPYHDVEDDKLVLVPKGVAAAIGALNGARGGMDISDEDRKGAYNVLVKAYKKCYPDQDPPELKALTESDDKGMQRKGVYVEFENSWDDIRCDLSDLLLEFLFESDVAGPADSAYIVDMFPDQAIVCVFAGGNAFYGPCEYGGTPYNDDRLHYYVLTWAMNGDDPEWTGEPQEVEITPEIKPAAERALRAMSEQSFLKESHVKKLAKAMEHLETARDHDDATTATKGLANKAHGHIKAVHDAHEKGVLSAAHKKRLEKGMGYCSEGAEHEESTGPMAKCFKSAGRCVKDVMDGAGSETAHEPGGTKSAALTADNRRHVKAAYHHLRAAAFHHEATKAVAEMAHKAAGKISSLFETGGDDGSDYDQTGNYTGEDMDSYTVTGGSAAGDGKTVEPLAKAASTILVLAHEFAGKLATLNDATGPIKDLAKGAILHLGKAFPELTPAEALQDDDDGDMSFHEGNPTGGGFVDGQGVDANLAPPKSLGDLLSFAADEAEFARAEQDEEKLFDLVESAGALERLVGVVRELRSAKP